MNDDQIRNPKHYQLLDGVESITIIASAMTVEQWRGFCLGNIIKYRLRAGNKDAEFNTSSMTTYNDTINEINRMLDRCNMRIKEVFGSPAETPAYGIELVKYIFGNGGIVFSNGELSVK